MNKKTLKRFLAVFLVAIISTFGLGIVGTSAEENFNGFIYEVKTNYADDSQYIAITGYNGSASALEIPAEINGVPVTKIEYTAFADNSTITSVTVPDSVTVIDSAAFRDCVNLADVTLPESLEKVGSSLLSGTAYEAANMSEGMLYCGNYLLDADTYEIPENVTVKEGTTLIAYNVFFGADISSVNLPSSLKIIGDSAFGSCEFLTSVEIPNGVEVIDSHAFSYCENLESISIPDSVTSLGLGVFSECLSLKSLDVPASVTELPAFMINGCPEITEFEIKDTVTTIKTNTFTGTSIKSIHIPASVEDVYASAFASCTELDVITVDEGNPKYYAKDNILYKKASYEGGFERLIRFTCDDSITSFTVPENVNYIESEAFSGVTALKELTLSSQISNFYLMDNSSVENVYVHPDNENFVSEDGVLYSKDMTKLEYYPAGKTAEALTIKDSVTTLEIFAIYENPNIKSITIPSTVTEVKSGAIGYCENLTEININTTTGVDSSAINGCYNLSTINFAGTVAEWEALGLYFSSLMCEDGLYAYCSDGTVEIVPPVITEPITTEPITTEPITTVPVTTEPEEIPTIPVTTAPDTTGSDMTEPSESVTTVPQEVTTITTEPSENVTTAPQTTPTTTAPKSEFEIGDVNTDGKLNIKDATTIQKFCAKMVSFTAEQEALADYNLDAKINVKDATQIQKKLANLI